MRIRHYSQGKFYLIECPGGTRVVRRWAPPTFHGPDPGDLLLVPFRGRAIPIPADPPGLLPLLAESGRCGLSLVGGPQPDVWLAGAACPGCGQGDVAWLCVEDDGETAHCDACGSDFGLVAPIPRSHRIGD